MHAQRFAPVAALEVRDDEAGGERVARRRSVDGFDLRRRRPRDLLPFSSKTAPSAPSVSATSFPREFTSCS